MTLKKGDKIAQEWNVENALPRFEDALKYAEENDACLCLQDAIYISGIPYSTFYYLADSQSILDNIKKGINSAIIRRINRLALEREKPVQASAAIWRMKQLGERDEQHINTNQTSKTEITVTSKEAQKELDNLIEKFEKE